MKRDYYPLNESAQMMGLTVDDLISLGINEKLKIIVLVKNKAGYLLDSHLNTILPYTPITISDRYFYVRKESLEVYESEKASGKVPMLDHGKKSDNSGNHWKLLFEDEYIPLTENSLCILSDDIKQYRDQQPQVVKDSDLNNQVMAGVKNKSDKTTRTRIDNLNRAINAAIIKIGKKPSLDELWQYFQSDKDETGFIEDYKETHLTWKTTKGKLKDTQKESIANRLSRVKS